MLLGDGRETSGLKSLLARPESATAQNPPTGVVCSAGVQGACCCLVSLIQLPVTAIGTLKVALRSRTVLVDPDLCIYDEAVICRSTTVILTSSCYDEAVICRSKQICPAADRLARLLNDARCYTGPTSARGCFNDARCYTGPTSARGCFNDARCYTTRRPAACTRDSLNTQRAATERRAGRAWPRSRRSARPPPRPRADGAATAATCPSIGRRRGMASAARGRRWSRGPRRRTSRR